MPSLDNDISSMEKSSIIEIDLQMTQLHQKSPGLFNGWKNGNDALNSKEEFEKSNNISLFWPNDNRKARTAALADIPMCSEMCISMCYAGAPIHITLVFTPRQPWMPPDIFISPDDGFMDLLTVDTIQTKVSSLKHWRERKRESVATLISELYLLFKEYNLNKLEEFYPDLWEQHKLFEKDLSIAKNKIEVYIAGTEVSICVQLPIEFDQLPPGLFPKSEGQAKCVLQLTAKDNYFRPKLHLSPRAEFLLGADRHTFTSLSDVPYGNAAMTTCTASVICQVQDLIKKCLTAFEIRKQVTAQLLCQYEEAICEYDATHFSSVELLLKENDFHYLAVVEFPPDFPLNRPPIINLKSICVGENEKPVWFKVPNSPPPSTNDPEKIMESILNASRTYSRNLKKICPTF